MAAVMVFSSFLSAQEHPDSAWPSITRVNRPWTRWWWLGNAVDANTLTQLLETYGKAGIGGVELCPIYGVKGFENESIPFLSPKWMAMLAHTVSEAGRLNMGVDMTTGSGWPFGGPNVGRQDAASRILLKSYRLDAGAVLNEPIPEGRLQTLMAYSDHGKILELTRYVRANRRLDWMPTVGKWRLVAAVQQDGVKMVKRAAPGGEGFVVDPFSVNSLTHYLSRFDTAFHGYHGILPRAQFHDSYEYDPADWTDLLFSEFKKRRGYDLKTKLPALLGEGSADDVGHVKSDYRETLSELHLGYVRAWSEWCHKRGMLSRNQAHGVPSNLLDAYAIADIPETEIFRSVGPRNIPMMKFASSAAHVTGKSLASSESFTWLDEHFTVSLAQIKRAFDHLMVSGINHVFFHGTPYSPPGVPWPGWQFYASTEFSPTNSIWRDLPAFNAYAARCQSILQSGESDEELLLYFPVYDLWNRSTGMLIHHTINGLWAGDQAFFDTALLLTQKGYTYDYISDSLLARVTAGSDGSLRTGNNTYKAILVPRCRLMPVQTLRKLVQLAEAGAVVFFQDSIPSDVPGFSNLEQRRTDFRKILQALHFSNFALPGVREAVLGRGRFLSSPSVEVLLQNAGISREPIVDRGVYFARRRHAGGRYYFFTNLGNDTLDGWMNLGVQAKSAVLFDPMIPNRIGMAGLQDAGGTTQVYLQLMPGESCILRTFSGARPEGSGWTYLKQAGSPVDLSGTWNIHFFEGGPSLPADIATRALASWTDIGDAEAKRFAGTARYSLEFNMPPLVPAGWILDLGRVCESASVKVNGKAVVTLFSAPFRAIIGNILVPGKNVLEIEVTNLPANRIADLDRRKVDWKIFHEINFVNIDYKPFDASGWQPRDSGLLGPVRMIPFSGMDLNEGR